MSGMHGSTQPHRTAPRLVSQKHRTCVVLLQLYITRIDQPALEAAIKENEDGATQKSPRAETELETTITGMIDASVEEVNKLRQEWETKKAKMLEDMGIPDGTVT